MKKRTRWALWGILFPDPKNYWQRVANEMLVFVGLDVILLVVNALRGRFDWWDILIYAAVSVVLSLLFALNKSGWREVTEAYKKEQQ